MKYLRAVLADMCGLSHRAYEQEGAQGSADVSGLNIPLDELTKRNIAHALWLTEYDEEAIPEPLLLRIRSAKNSNAAFAQRFRERLEGMMKQPLSFVPSRKDRYRFFLEHSQTLSPSQFYSRVHYLGPESVVGYEPVPTDPHFTFPHAPTACRSVSSISPSKK